jgi:CheY-like chemotaxis protein/membrane protein implicated in regulation of membrane protease activity
MRGQFRILIVDDEDNFLRSISRMLQDFSASTDTALNNKQALNRFQQIPYDLVIVDMNMPDFDGEPNKLAGIKLVEKLREIDATLPTIILTGEDEATTQTMLAAKKLQHIDVYLKNLSSGDELVQKIDELLKESEVTLLASDITEPVSFKRTDILNLQGVVSRIDGDGGEVFIVEREGVLPSLIGHHWLAKAGYGQLREEPVDIIGVQANRFVVTSTDNIIFLRDFYRNDILAHKKDLENLVGEIVDVNEQMKRHGVQITSGNAPEYLTSKRYWQAVTDDDAFLPMYTEVDLLGEGGGKLRIRLHQTLILDENGQEAEITEAHVSGLLGKVVKPIDEDDQGTLQIISEEAPEVLRGDRWQAASGDEMIFIPGERVEVVGVRDKKLLVGEVIEEA